MFYGVTVEGDPWGYYELFTPTDLAHLQKTGLPVRVDSGCDIGQIFNDRGCECRDQLHHALRIIVDHGNGLIVHIPSQDGRGFGAATKMETEGLKNGIIVATNGQDPHEMDTDQAARELLGDHYDIRTYDGAGRILEALGVKSVSLETDNREKVEGISGSGIEVVRRSTETTGNNGSARHVRAKHRTGRYYDD